MINIERWIWSVGIALAVLAAQPAQTADQAKLPAIPKTGKSLKDFVPASWTSLKQAPGDLNTDSLPDLAVVLKSAAEDKDEGGGAETSRLLLILFGTKDGGYTLAASSAKAVLCKGCGGVFGDPFAKLGIERGALVIEHYGGSSERWGYTHRWRYQGGDFLLIGLTTRSDDTRTGALEVKDENLVTDVRVVDRTDADGKSSKTRERVPAKPLQKLSAFTFEP